MGVQRRWADEEDDDGADALRLWLDGAEYEALEAHNQERERERERDSEREREREIHYFFPVQP